MRLFTKLIATTCALTGGGFLFNYFSSSQAPTVVKSKGSKIRQQEYKDWVTNRNCVPGQPDDDC